MDKEYNPLDYDNLTRNCVRELMGRGPYALPLTGRFNGSGVYAFFYCGDLDFYTAIKSPMAEQPIYVGKAVPSGARKGRATAGPSEALYVRIREHQRSLEAAENLAVNDFLCRYLVVTLLWITMAERFLIEHYQPLWNIHIDGFGNYPPGKGRPAGDVSWWDTLHPGREWAAALPRPRSRELAENRVREYFRMSSEKLARLAERAAALETRENV